MSEFPGAIDYFVDRSRVFQNQNSHSAIVCHGTGGNPAQTVEQLGDFFRTTANKTSVHYGIGRDGRYAQYVLEQDGAAGNCCLTDGHDPFWDQFGGDNLNIHTLSFETENDSENSLPLTDPQKATTFKLIKYWVDKYNIPLDNIKSHASLDPGSRSRCPGPNFPWDELFAYLNSGGQTNMATIPQGWTDDGTVLTAPNGHHVIQGFRGWVLTHNNWDPNNQPLEEVQAANPVEDYYNQPVNAGTRQLFTYCELAWTSARGVYVVGVGNELRGARKDLANAKAEIALLTKQIADASQTALGQQVAALQAKIAQAVKDLS